MMRSETYNKQNNIFNARNQLLEKSVYLFRKSPAKSRQNPC